MSLPPARPRVDPATPVLVLTRAELSLAGTVVATLAELTRGSGRIAALERALPQPPAAPTIVLQADERTDMAVITRVIETARNAGYTHVLFAVKHR
jgi:biopolymer transport protein ExbD